MGRFWTRTTPFWGWDRRLKDVFTGVPTSSRRYLWRRHLGWHHPRWRRRKWRQPRLGENFSIPIAAAAENGGPSASGRHLGWPRNRKMRSSTMATGSGRAAIFHSRCNRDRTFFLYYWRHQMEAFLRVTGPLCWEFPGHRWIPLTKDH